MGSTGLQPSWIEQRQLGLEASPQSLRELAVAVVQREVDVADPGEVGEQLLVERVAVRSSDRDGHRGDASLRSAALAGTKGRSSGIAAASDGLRDNPGCIEAGSSVPGPGALARRRGHLYGRRRP
jgi:hypothetical protein